MDQPKIERMLRLMQLLSGNVDYTIGELADRLEMSPRTIYRYIDTFKAAGFSVTKLYGDVYKLAKMPRNAVEIDKLIYFSEEEAYLVNSLIDQLVPTNSLKANLKEKLSAIYSSTSIADYVDRRSNAAHVEALGKAIEGRLQVVLRDYESGHSHTIRDRRIEPYGFTSDYIDVLGYDLEDGGNKTFKVSRIGEVEVLDEAWTAAERHRPQKMDIFRISGDSPIHIRLKLSFMAKNLLVEEYPLASRDLRREGDDWILDTQLYGLGGAARFVAGLLSEIEILDAPELKAYLRDSLARGLEKTAQ